MTKPRDGILLHGRADRSRVVSTLLWEARVLGAELRKQGVRVPVVTVMCVHGAAVPAGKLDVDGVMVVEGRRLVTVLRTWVGGVPADRGAFERVTAAAGKVLPRYVERGGRS